MAEMMSYSRSGSCNRSAIGSSCGITGDTLTCFNIQGEGILEGMGKLQPDMDLVRAS
jgi:hypothetical protein